MATIQVQAPAGFAPATAIGFGALGSGVTAVDATNPLPVATRANQTAAHSSALAGSADASGLLGPFVPELGRAIWATLSGNWAGTVTVKRSIDGGTTLLPLTFIDGSARGCGPATSTRQWARRASRERPGSSISSARAARSPIGWSSDMADYEAQGLALKALATAGTRALRMMPVGCGTDFPFQLSTGVFTAGFQAMSKSLHYLPRGGRNLRLLLVGGAYAGVAEAANASGFPLKLAVAREPAPWNPTKAYVPGDMVSYYATNGGGGSYNSNPYFICAAASTGSPPTPGNANWAPGTRPTTYPIRVGGVQDASFATQATPDGAIVARAWIKTDILPISFEAAGWLGVYGWMPCSGSQVFPIWNQQQPLSLGPTLEYAASVTDKTAGATFSAPRAASVPAFTPVGIVGVPAQATKSVVVIGDSIAQGKFPGASPIMTLASGGTGYKAGDVLTLARTGATPGAVAAASDARAIVDAVSSGVITVLRTLATGGYADIGSQTGQTRPSGTLGLAGGSGSGATVTVSSYSANAYDDGDAVTGGQGWIKRALLSIGVPHASFTASGDRLSLWTTNAGRRLSAMGELGADIAIVALGRNDLSAGDSAATIEANLAALVAMLRGIGIARIYGVTVTPETTSTSAAGQSTLADQVVTANDPARQALNAWLCGTSHPFDAVLDVAALVEDGGAVAPTGRFTPIGSEPFSADGKHPGTSGVLAMMPAITARVALFA